MRNTLSVSQRIYLAEHQWNLNLLDHMKPPFLQKRPRRIFQVLMASLFGLAASAQNAPPAKPSAAADSSAKSGSSGSPCPATGNGGILNFANRAKLSGVDAQVFDSGGKQPLSGPGYLAQLYGAPCDRETAFIPLDKAVPFREGIAAGYIKGTTLTLPHVGPGQPVYVQMRCWEALFPTYEIAVERRGAAGKSGVVRVTAGGAVPGTVGLFPPDLVGLKPFDLSAPKPR